jgi:hypothetical protein
MTAARAVPRMTVLPLRHRRAVLAGAHRGQRRASARRARRSGVVPGREAGGVLPRRRRRPSGREDKHSQGEGAGCQQWPAPGYVRDHEVTPPYWNAGSMPPGRGSCLGLSRGTPLVYATKESYPGMRITSRGTRAGGLVQLASGSYPSRNRAGKGRIRHRRAGPTVRGSSRSVTTLNQRSSPQPGTSAAMSSVEPLSGRHTSGVHQAPVPTAQRNGSRCGLDGLARTMRHSLILRSDLPLDDWKVVGERISAICDSSSWWIGDWLLFGRANYPDRYRQAIRETSLDYQTLRNYAWVAGRFSVSRRRDTLSFQHHLEVASLPSEQQDVWLNRAEKFAWSRNELRSKLKAQLQTGRRTAKVEVTVRLNVSAERKERWQAAAERAGVDIVRWIAAALDQMAEQGDQPVMNTV